MLATSMMLGGRPVYDITLPSNRSQWQKSVDGTQVPSNIQVLLILRINNVIEIQSNSTSIGAIHLDALANGSEVQIINLGYLLGRGGAGATGGNGGQGGNPGGTAGAAVRADFTGLLNITNGSGNIWGGGGGGGGGGGCFIWNVVDLAYEDHSGGGGGGGGAGGGSAGAGGPKSSWPGAVDGSAGTAGVTGSAGTGSAGGGGGDASAASGATGGAYGVNGAASLGGSGHGGGPGASTNGAAGGVAGYAVRHNAGTTVNFISGSGFPNTKGSIGV